MSQQVSVLARRKVCVCGISPLHAYCVQNSKTCWGPRATQWGPWASIAPWCTPHSHGWCGNRWPISHYTLPTSLKYSQLNLCFSLNNMHTGNALQWFVCPLVQLHTTITPDSHMMLAIRHSRRPCICHMQLSLVLLYRWCGQHRSRDQASLSPWTVLQRTCTWPWSNHINGCIHIYSILLECWHDH